MARKEVSRRSPTPSKPTPRPNVPGTITMISGTSGSHKVNPKLPLHTNDIKRFVRIEAKEVYGLELIVEMVRKKCEVIGIEVFSVKSELIGYKSTLIFNSWLTDSEIESLVKYLSSFDGLHIKVMVNDEITLQIP